MGLDARGNISIVEIVFYVPIIFTTLIITLRHSFSRRAGWIFLLILAIIRIVGSAIHLASENKPSDTSLRATYVSFEGAGLSPLLVATLGFLQTIAQHGFDDHPRLNSILRLMGIMSLVGLGLVIDVGVLTAKAGSNLDKLNSAAKHRHAGSIIFVVLFVAIVLLHLYFWIHREEISQHRRMLLIGISCALPFIGIRIIYGILSSYAPVIPGIPGPSNHLSKFSLTTGSWGIYLGMAVIMEFIAVLIYTCVGILTPLQRDQNDAVGSRDYHHYQLNRSIDSQVPMTHSGDHV